jgi:hypothetical protein
MSNVEQDRGIRGAVVRLVHYVCSVSSNASVDVERWYFT